MASTAALLMSIFFSTYFSTGEAKDCLGTFNYLNAENVNEFDQCHHVRGNLIINEKSIGNYSSFPLTYKDLFKLSHIREIDGYLLIEWLNHSSITNLRFLRQLERIRGQETVRLFGVQDYTLLIQNNPHLVTLNLASLTSIENGGLRISDNPQLCLVDSIPIESYLVNSTLSRIGGLGYFCSGVTCHGECVEENGCWGTLPDECIVCRSYKFLQTCVDTCNLSISLPHQDRQECVPITSENLLTMTTFTLGTSTDVSINDNSSTLIEISVTSNLPTLLIRENTSPTLILSLVPAGVILLITMAIAAIALLVYCQKRKKCRAISLNQQKHSSMTGTPEKYSGNGNDRTILVASRDEGDTSSSSTRRSTNVSISSLASASIHSEDRKEDLAQDTRVHDEQQLFRGNTTATAMTVTRRNSPMEHTQANTSSSASCYTSSGDTGYSSGATSRKPSLVGSRASSSSLRQPLSIGGATGNVYSTGQHQLHPHRQLYHQHVGQNQRSRSSLTSYQTNTSLGSTAARTAMNDQVNISILASNSELFESH